ncbi:hypothetical protein UCREL1_7688 [Eutypa lata UCREL1]|uniref:RNase T2-like C-terminal domain-containing protein n=1 Tax=Eutypa lata (strain UCR-EL1) TaxID=1287681 RepID=M7TF60_EUTLA|nr:hypothetical protein UCREL1_7688 [Eutypa lata UCREL1]
MQFKNAALFVSALLPAAIMASLPATLELLAFQNGQRIGCVNGYGKFITSELACYPFRAMAIEGSDNRNLWAVGYGTCSTESGTLECYEPEGEPSAFTLNGADLELVGTGTSFSANSKPDTDDRMGVEIIVGDGGSEDFFLQVHAVSG